MIGYQISRKGNNGRKSEENYGKQPLTNIEKVVIVTQDWLGSSQRNMELAWGASAAISYMCVCVFSMPTPRSSRTFSSKAIRKFMK